MSGCFIFFHAKSDTKEDIFYDVEYGVYVPIINVFLQGKGAGVQKKKKSGGKIDKTGDHNPEFLGVIYE